jgi:ketosteroid isomerase-like protein
VYAVRLRAQQQEAAMADEAGNVDMLKRAYKRWHDTRGGSAEEWMAICADNIAFGSIAQGVVPGAHYLTGYQSRNALSEYFAGITRDWDMIEYVAEQFVAQGDRVVMLGRCAFRHKHTGKVVSSPKADSWRFAGGKAVEFYEYFDTAQVQAAAT